MNQSKDTKVYKRILDLVEEVRPWYRVLDDNTTSEKLHTELVRCMDTCALFLIGELTYFPWELSSTFCLTTLGEYAMSCIKDKIYEFAHGICSSLFSSQESSSIIVINIIVQVLNTVANGSEVKTKNTVKFLKLVSYCVNECKSASVDFCGTLASCLEEIAGDFHEDMSTFELILSLNAVALKFIFSSSRDENHDNGVDILVEDGDRQKRAALLSLLRKYFHVGSDIHLETGQYYSQLTSDRGASIASQSMEKSLLLDYFYALEVLCEFLAKRIYREKEQIITSDEAASVSHFWDIRDTFFHFCDIFFCCRSCLLGEEIIIFNESNRAIFKIAVATFTLSLKIEFNDKRSVHLIKHIIKSEWIQFHDLKYLYVCLNNIASLLYENKQLKEASKTLKLGYSASWTYVIHLCQTRATEISTDSDLLGNGITNSVNDTITITDSFIHVLDERGNKNVKEIIMESLKNWFVAKSLFEGLPVPTLLVKQWVKMVCRSSRDMDQEVRGQSLHSLLSSSTKLSKITIGLFLEQEIDEYGKLSGQYPEICQKMQMKIINIFMSEVYIAENVAENSCLQEAKLMIKKARLLRVHRSDIMEDCIHCLSEAISLINETYGETRSHAILQCHQLAVAYCLRALCTQEAKSDSKQLLEDINAALNIWLNIFSQDHCSVDDICSIEVEYTMLLLYNAMDLLSCKCFLDFHPKIYSLMIRVFNRKNVPLEKFVAIFWGSRRTSHGLCISPINEAFLTTLSQQDAELPKSINSWTLCLRESQAMLGRLQQNFSIFCENSILAWSNENFQLDMTVDEVKDAASKLISTLPATDHSIFLAGSLYYSLCERHISNGRILEALCYAKDAYRLHAKLFHKKFIYAIKKRNEKDKEAAAVCDLTNFLVYGSSLHEIWSFNNNSWNFEGYLSPWNVLQSYLESILQVGTIYEIIGNSAEAELFLLWGKNISCIQGLPLFIASFSSILGKLYQKKQSWDLAKEELHSAQKILREQKYLSCLNCKLMLEVTVDQHLGDLFQSNVDVVNTTNICLERLTRAENFYRSALDKLKNQEESGKDYASVSANDTGSRNFDGKSRTRIETRSCRKAANARKASKKKQTVILDTNTRITHSKCQPSTKEFLICCTEGQKHLKGQSVTNCSNTTSRRKKHLLLDVNNLVAACGCGELSSRCNNIRCWRCLCMEVMISGLIDKYVKLKWEYIRRQLLVRLLVGIGTCSGNRGKIHETHEIFLEGLSAVASKTLYNENNYLPQDVFAVEHGKLLYITSWFLLKSHRENATRFICCNLSQVQFATLVSWLRLAFTLCREVPTVVQKISRLLAIVHVASSSSDYFSLPSHKTLSESHWASFFHQASLGTHINYEFDSNIAERLKVHDFDKDEEFYISSSTCIEEQQTCSLLRTAPESTCDLEEFIMKFFKGLPCTTIICVTLLGKNYSSLLQDLLIFPSCVRACVLLSRFNSKHQPLVLVLPVKESLEDIDFRSSLYTLPEGKDWQCPWGFSVIDDVVPEFKRILRDNYACLCDPISNRNSNLWWRKRHDLDIGLQMLLRIIEESWLGPWRIMLLGDWQRKSTLDSVCKKLVHELKLKAKIYVNESLLKVILGGSKDDVKVETFVSELCSKKGCYVGRGECYDEERKFEALYPASSAIKKTYDLAIELISEAISQFDEDTGNKEPIILVLDCEVQMLPWENVPIMRNQEVYRMPSVGSISMMFDRRQQHQTQDNRISFPLIDPWDAFYLVNPSGDLQCTRVEHWFKDQPWEGRAGSAPTAEELAIFLESHDLFIYFGHGSGSQFIPEDKIRKLKNCAASLLLGCSSGSLNLKGSYVPQGTPLSYLQGGSPFIVANLWDVAVKGIHMFNEAILNAWLRERSNVSAGFCSHCDLASKEPESLKIGSEAAKKKDLKNKLLEKGKACDGNCNHRPKIGYFMSQARKSCDFRFLTGAAPVCYGIPTGIWRKKVNDQLVDD